MYFYFLRDTTDFEPQSIFAKLVVLLSLSKGCGLKQTSLEGCASLESLGCLWPGFASKERVGIYIKNWEWKEQEVGR